ncbi:MAG: hypothetical protein HYU62_03935 [Caulobacterales bacterium]|nr:hypothetical protein [Caulobacterales bacterium]
MPNALRHLCIGLCVAVLAAMNLHGLSQSQHAVGHAADWPAIALSEADEDHHGHVHVAPEEAPDTDPDRDTDGARPVGHHHHAGGDIHAALPLLERDMTEASSLTSALRWAGPDPVLPSLSSDGPEYPPKRMRTVV